MSYGSPGLSAFGPAPERRASSTPARLWAGLVDLPVVAPDPFLGPAILATGAERVAFDMAECTRELRP
ncbi:MAG TPA: hypothetical protein VFX28_18265, partial [Methylomirabilota bacterium]|nr:hypothetical protein [Methylomirabilota bacterium]